MVSYSKETQTPHETVDREGKRISWYKSYFLSLALYSKLEYFTLRSELGKYVFSVLFIWYKLLGLDQVYITNRRIMEMHGVALSMLPLGSHDLHVEKLTECAFDVSSI